MEVSIDKDIAEDLISYKIRKIQKHIGYILTRWNESEASVFLEKSKNGTYSEAENDAIYLRQLLMEETNLHQVFNSL